MKLLHTSDWHIGRSLYGRKRHEEHEAFLDWLAHTLQEQAVDALLVAGDVFDSGTPGTRAQELYYRFLCRAAASSCRHVVIIAGNHDSPSFLNAPKELLKALNVHVVGSGAGNPEEEVLLLRDCRGAPELIVCAVPYLRDKDIRIAEAGESLEDKERKLFEGIRGHYAAVADAAGKRLRESGASVPVVGMGHLFAAGGKTLDGDGVRELYVGSLAHVPAGIFPALFNYLALGHLHVPQKVNGSESIRYSGSPLPMGFGEARQQKNVCLIDFHDREASVSLLDVPCFQRLERLKGDLPEIEARLSLLAEEDSSAWLEVIYEGQEIIGDLRERLEAAVAGTRLEILRIRNTRVIDRALSRIKEEESLDALDPHDVFERCLDAHAVAVEQRPDLRLAYRESLASVQEDAEEADEHANGRSAP